MTQTELPELLTVAQAAALLSEAPSMVMRRMRAGTLPYLHKPGGTGAKVKRIHRADVIALLVPIQPVPAASTTTTPSAGMGDGGGRDD